MISPIRAAVPSLPSLASRPAERVDAAVLGQERPEVPRLADLARRLKAGEKVSPEPFGRAFRSPDPVERRAADLLLYDLSYSAVPMEDRPALHQDPPKRLYERLHQFLAACSESDWPIKPEDIGPALAELEGLQGPVPPEILKATVHLAYELQKRADSPRAQGAFRIRELELPALDATWAKALAGQAQRWADDGRVQTALPLAAETLQRRLVVDGNTVTAPPAPRQHPPEIAALAAEIAEDLNHYECSGGVQKGRQDLNDLAGTDPAKAEQVLQALIDGLDLLNVDRQLGKLGTLIEHAMEEADTLPHLAPLLRTQLPRLLKFPEEAERLGKLAPRRYEGVAYYRCRFYGAVVGLAGPSADREVVLDQLARLARHGYRADREMPEQAAGLFRGLARKDPSLAEPLARLTLAAMPMTGGSKPEWEHLHAAVTEHGWKPQGEDLEALAARLYFPPDSKHHWAQDDFLNALQTLSHLDVSGLRLPGRDGAPVTLPRHAAERLLFQEDSPGNLHLPRGREHGESALVSVHRFCLGDESTRELLVEQAPTNPRAMQLLASSPLSDAEAARLQPAFADALLQRTTDRALSDLLDELRRRSDDPAVQVLRFSAYAPAELPREVLLGLRADLAASLTREATMRTVAARLEDRPAREWTAAELVDLRASDPSVLLDRLAPRLVEAERGLVPGAAVVLAPWQEALWDRTLAEIPGSSPLQLVELVERGGALLGRACLDARVQAEPLLACWASAAGVEAEDRSWAFEVYRQLVRADAPASACADLLERLGPRTRASAELLEKTMERVKTGQPWEIALLHAKAEQNGLPMPEAFSGEPGVIEARGATIAIGGITLDVKG